MAVNSAGIGATGFITADGWEERALAQMMLNRPPCKNCGTTLEPLKFIKGKKPSLRCPNYKTNLGCNVAIGRNEW